jgi:Uncharacterized conserved protein
MQKRKIAGPLLVIAALVAIWFLVNPPGRFGWSCFGYSAFNSWPRPISDFQVRSDGSTRTVKKTHQLTFTQIEWLLEPKPDVLIVAIGWDGVTNPDDRIRDHKECELHVLRNKEAIDLFNGLKRAGRRVAIHYHSTC